MNWNDIYRRLPPWYDSANHKLEGYEWAIDWLLIGVILITVLLLIKGDRVMKSTWLVYVALP